MRRQKIAFVFQDAINGLNPVKTVGWQIAEVLMLRAGHSRGRARREAIDLDFEVMNEASVTEYLEVQNSSQAIEGVYRKSYRRQALSILRDRRPRAPCVRIFKAAAATSGAS